MNIQIRPSFPGPSRPQAGVDVGASSEISNLLRARESAESARRVVAVGLPRATTGAATAEPRQSVCRALQIPQQNESKNAFGFKKMTLRFIYSKYYRVSCTLLCGHVDLGFSSNPTQTLGLHRHHPG